MKKFFIAPYTQTGFTLVELVLAVFIFSAITAGVAAFGVYYFQSYSFSFEENQSIGLAQTAITTMIREIREARSGDDGAYALTQVDDNTLIFYSDVTNDGRSDRVRYFLNGTDLKKGVIEPTQVPVTYPTDQEKVSTIASYVDNAGQPLFIYYNGDYPTDTVNNPLPQVSRLLNTRFISVYLRINIAVDYSAQPFEIASGVQIRSLKDNL